AVLRDREVRDDDDREEDEEEDEAVEEHALELLCVADLGHRLPEELDRALLAVRLPTGGLVETSGAGVVVEHPQHDVSVAELAHPFLACTDQLAADAAAPVGGIDVEHVELAVRIGVAARTDADEAGDLRVDLGHERWRKAAMLVETLLERRPPEGVC